MIFFRKNLHFLFDFNTCGHVSNMAGMSWCQIYLQMEEILVNFAEWLLLTWFWGDCDQPVVSQRWPLCDLMRSTDVTTCGHQQLIVIILWMVSAILTDHSIEISSWCELELFTNQIWSANITSCDQSSEVHVPAVNRVERSVTSPWPLSELRCK